MARQSLQSWISEILIDPEKGACTLLVCLHTIGSAKKDIHHINLTSGKQWTAEELAQVFENKAKSFAQDLPGTQLFEMEAFYGGTTAGPQAYHPFRVEGENLYALGGTDSPDGKGLVQQSMRHTEAMTSLAYQALAQNNALLQGMVTQLAGALTISRQAELDAVGIVKDLVLERGNNAHKQRMEELTYARQTEERAKWLQFAPPLINSVLGREIFPQNTEDTALVEAIAGKLTAADVQKLAGILPPEYMGPLAARIEKFLTKKRKESKQDKKLLTDGIDPEDDAAGDVPRGA